jgi:UDP-3-O-[3-hydroxymyristoyl] glucosamine N-acyltransferase
MFNLREISVALNIPFEGSGDIEIVGLSEPESAQHNQIAVALNKYFEKKLISSDARVALVLRGMDWRRCGLDGVLVVENSRYGLSQINGFFEKKIFLNKGVHSSAIISKTAKIGRNVSIGAFSVIGDKCEIGDGSRIFDNVTISEEVVIGNSALLYSGTRIGPRVKIGDDFICHFNSVIGSDGFSFASPGFSGLEKSNLVKDLGTTPTDIKHFRIASLGSIRIGNDVELGASVNVDRGTISNTEIGDGTKIDNLVHIGHNVKIGNNCLICGQVGIAGSALIEDRVVLGGQVGIADHVRVGHDTIVAGKSGVSSNVPSGRFMMGNPAVKMENNIESYKALRRLPRLVRKIEELQKLLLR